jgi:nucleotide-binding universal stress UspA family protein
MYEKILVPLDGSKVAEAALPNVADLAMRMAPKTRIEVTLLQVISNLTYNVLTPEELAQIPYSEEDLKQIKQKSLDYLEKVAGTLRAKRIEVKTIVTVGHAAEEIIKVARQTDANVIAMSTHGYSGVKRWALGSIADKVLHISDIPVLLIRVK